MMKKLIIALAALWLAAPATAALPARIDFTLAPTRAPSDKVQLELSYRAGRGESRHSRPIPLRTLQGLAAAQLAASAGAPIRFRLVRDAGALECDGVARGGRGTGSCRFAANAAFATALAKRGIARPTGDQQFQLAIQGAELAVADELIRQGYGRPSAQNLVETAIFDVDVPFLRGLEAAGYRVGSVSKLVQMRIHGVTPAYIRDLATIGEAYRRLPIDALVQMRIHDVTAARLRDYAQLGYPALDHGQMVSMAIHGVSPAFIREMAEAGYRKLTPEQLVNLRIHGVNGEMARVARTAVRGN